MELLKTFFGIFKMDNKPYKCLCNKTVSNEYCDSMFTLLNSLNLIRISTKRKLRKYMK